MNINKLMKQAQQMQKQMQDMQEKMAEAEFEGSAGGGLVKIVLSGKGEAKKIEVDASLLEKDEKEVLEDLLVAAHNDAKAKADAEMEGTMGGMMPAGMKLPF